MAFNIFKNLFDSNEKQIQRLQKIVDKANEFEPEVSKLSDEELKAKTEEFKKRLDLSQIDEIFQTFPTQKDDTYRAGMRKVQAKLFEIMPEAFAVVREASKRHIQHRHFDVQLMAGIVLAEGKIAEQRTGEGKTISCHPALYLYALLNKGSHIVTVNDYLAKVGAEFAGHVFAALDMTVGVVQHEVAYKFVTDDEAIKLKGDEVKEEIEARKKTAKENGRMLLSSLHGTNLVECSKKEAYDCDITYGTNNEFGFDYLRDNMTRSLDRIVQGDLFFCIVDEVDSVLIDEARTPLIISAPAEKSNDLYLKFAQIVKKLDPTTDYEIDEKAHSATLTEAGMHRVEKTLGVENLWEDYRMAHHVDNALKAETLYKEGDEYLVRDGEVVIVDEFTGRLMKGRRFSEGLHQAIEAKEGVEIKQESLTLATVSFQNFFRLYDVLAGMTGTAVTEAEEFSRIYNLDVVVMPTNKPIIRKDQNDVIYKTSAAKFKAVADEIKERNQKGQPVLVGTRSVEISEMLSLQLEKMGVKHKVLNAKQHEKEASIVADAGQKGSVTIATNMAGRGTDIALGEGVTELGGLYVIGTERHESRRIDNQLRGRSGRQGDPGESRFFIALDDEIMRIQGGEYIQKLFERINVPDDLPIENPIISKQIEGAQKRVEGWNFDTRKHLVDYDDVLNQQREIIYARRRKVLEEAEKKEGQLEHIYLDNLEDEIERIVETHFVISRDDEIDEKKVLAEVNDIIPDDLFEKACKDLNKDYKNLEGMMEKYDGPEVIQKDLLEIVRRAYEIQTEELGENMKEIEKQLTIQTMDQLWIEHLETMADLRAGIGLRGYAQIDPLVAYKNEGFEIFDQLMATIDHEIAHRILKVRKVTQQPMVSAQAKTNEGSIKGGADAMAVQQAAAKMKAIMKGQEKETKPQTVTSGPKVGRNDPCPCGSGKKYKKCCGKGL